MLWCIRRYGLSQNTRHLATGDVFHSFVVFCEVFFGGGVWLKGHRGKAAQFGAAPISRQHHMAESPVALQPPRCPETGHPMAELGVRFGVRACCPRPNLIHRI